MQDTTLISSQTMIQVDSAMWMMVKRSPMQENISHQGLLLSLTQVRVMSLGHFYELDELDQIM
jgi:hypothetical protein